MTEPTPGAPRVKKSVALSGVIAGNTALCTVGHTGNDLHYRGYDILDLAEATCFEEVAHLLIHGTLPTLSALRAYQHKLARLRGLPQVVRDVLERLPAASHPMDVLRTGISVLGCVLPEKDDHSAAGARDIADRLLACVPSMLACWYHASHNATAIDLDTEADSIAAHFLSSTRRRSRHVSSPAPAQMSTRPSAVPSVRCADPSTAVPTKWRWRSSSAMPMPMPPRLTSCAASRRAKWSSVSAIRSTRSVIRAM